MLSFKAGEQKAPICSRKGKPMKCSDCGKEVQDTTTVTVGEYSFCNNLCRMLWSKRNPDLFSQTIDISMRNNDINAPVLPDKNPINRIIFGLLWFVFFYMLSMILTGGIFGGITGAFNPSNGAEAVSIAAQAFIQKYGIFILIGNAVIVFASTFYGVLPGTNPHKNVKINPIKMGPFGPVSSIFLSILFFILSLIPTFIFGIIDCTRKILRDPKFDLNQYAEIMKNDGTFVAASILLSALVIIPLVILTAGTRKKIKLSDYLAFGIPNLSSMVLWFLIAGASVALFDFITIMLKKEIVLQLFITQYKSAGFVPLYFSALVIVAPFYEELIFRGFIFRGFLQSRAGEIGAVTITALIWAVIHQQYGLGRICGIFIIGILLGLARLTTKSIYPPILMHMLLNFIAFIEIIIVASGK